MERLPHWMKAKKKQEEAESAEEECEEMLEEIYLEGEEVRELKEMLIFKQNQLKRAERDEIWKLAEECAGLSRQLEELKAKLPSRDEIKELIVESINNNSKLFIGTLLKRKK